MMRMKIIVDTLLAKAVRPDVTIQIRIIVSASRTTP
jgi:hypothetical protein